MFIPIHDANQLRHIHRQYVTMTLIIVNVLAWLTTSLASERVVEAAIIGFGYIPSTVFNFAERPEEWVLVPDDLTYLTYAFLHGDIWHLGGNMLFLWVFGDNVEDALGHFRFLIFYLACAAAGAFAHGLAGPESQAPLIGASGAIAGVVTAYLILHPRVKIWVLALGRIPLRLPAWFLLALWIIFQVVMMVMADDGEISWAAHIGGILAGAVLVVLLRRRGVKLFDQATLLTPVPSAPEPQPFISPWERR